MNAMELECLEDTWKVCFAKLSTESFVFYWRPFPAKIAK